MTDKLSFRGGVGVEYRLAVPLIAPSSRHWNKRGVDKESFCKVHSSGLKLLAIINRKYESLQINKTFSPATTGRRKTSSLFSKCSDEDEIM